MERAVLKTLAYADIFDYPLKAWEIHKWLIGKSLSLRQVEKVLEKLKQKKLINNQNEFYFLSKRAVLVSKRLIRQQQSEKLISQAKLISIILKYLPGIKLIGISGALAMNNAQVDDDIDLFVITSKNRLWLIRLLTLALFTLIIKRRRPNDSRQQAAGKFCLNTILEDNQLSQQKQDIYIAHEVLQMQVLWQKDDAYTSFLFANQWVFQFLPNWIGREYVSFCRRRESRPQSKHSKSVILSKLNNYAEKLQRNYMSPVQGSERISQGAVYFHPQDYHQKVLSCYKQILLRLDI